MLVLKILIINLVGPTPLLTGISLFMRLYVGSGTLARAVMETSAESGMYAGPVPRQGNQESCTGQHHMKALRVGARKIDSGFSVGGNDGHTMDDLTSFREISCGDGTS